MTAICKRTCEFLPAEPVAKKTKGPDSGEAAPSDKQKSEKELMDLAAKTYGGCFCDGMELSGASENQNEHFSRLLDVDPYSPKMKLVVDGHGGEADAVREYVGVLVRADLGRKIQRDNPADVFFLDIHNSVATKEIVARNRGAKAVSDTLPVYLEMIEMVLNEPRSPARQEFRENKIHIVNKTLELVFPGGKRYFPAIVLSSLSEKISQETPGGIFRLD
jgi:hypothetical protein